MANPTDLDADLMLRVKRGDRGAFAELVEKYKQPVTNFIFRTLRDETEAEDLAQNVFLQVYKSRARYERTAKFSTWLLTIARNRVQVGAKTVVEGKELDCAWDIPPAPAGQQFEKDKVQTDTSLTRCGMVADGLWLDLNKDGWPDLVVAGPFMPVSVYENHKGKLEDRTAAYGLGGTEGWWCRLAAADLPGDASACGWQPRVEPEAKPQPDR